MSTPIFLPANQPAGRFYRGGPRIAEFRGAGGGASAGDHVPEDWVASVTTQAGEVAVGLTTLPASATDGARLLRDAVASDPTAWLGQAHVDAFGPDPLLLVKLLDPGQRLPVHVHPDDAWVAEHLGPTHGRPVGNQAHGKQLAGNQAHGKAEAWCILQPGEVWVGLRETVTGERLLDLVDAQDVPTLLALLHRREVATGDTVYVPPGVLHAIGEGVVLAEVQQPADLSIVLEWRGFDLDGAADGHLGLGFPIAIGAVELTARSDAEVDALITSGLANGPILAPGSAPYFRAERHIVNSRMELEQGYAVLVVLSGELELATEAGRLTVAKGATVLLPHAAGRPALTGTGEVLIFRPPAPGPTPEAAT